MRRKKDKLPFAILDKGIVSRKEIIRKSLIECGLLSKEDNEIFDRFWKIYKDEISIYDKDCFILDLP